MEDSNNNVVTLNDQNHIKLKLRSFTGTVMEIGLSAAKMSAMLKNTLDAFPGNYEEPIPLKNDALNDAALKKIIEWCEYHRNGPKLDEDFEDEKAQHSEDLCQWDKQFINIEDNALLYDIIVGAHYMGIDGLVEVGGKHICSKIRGKDSDEVRQILKIENDLTEEEVEKIHKENDWIYSKD